MRSTWAQNTARATALWAVMATVLACGKEPSGPTPPGTKGPTVGAKATAIPDPQAPSVPDLAVVVRVNRLDQTLPKLEALLTQVAPQMTAEQIKGMIGGMLNDPALANLDQTRSLMVCVFAPQGAKEPSGIGVIPVTSDVYADMFKARGQLVHPEKGGKTLLVADASQEAAMVASRQAYAQLEKMVGEPMKTDVSVYVNVELLMQRFGAQLEQGIQQMVKTLEQMQAATGQPTGMNQILQMEMAGLLNVTKEIKDLEATVAVSKTGVDAGAIVRAKPGTSLAGVLDKHPAADPALLGYVPGAGSIVGFCGADGKKLATFVAAKVDELFAATTQPAQINRQAIKDFITKSMGMSGSAAFDVLIPDAAGLLSMVSVNEITDPKAYEAMVREMPESMTKTGLADFYKSAGMEMKMTFAEKKREHSGVPIHLLTQDLAMPQIEALQPQMVPFLKAFTHMEYEFAIVGNYAVWDMGANKMDAVIDALKAKKPLATTKLGAQGSFPAGGQFYMDMRVDRLVRWGLALAEKLMGQMIQNMIPNGPQVIANLKKLEAAPISLFAAVSGGKLQARIVAPIEPVVKIKDTVMKAMEPPQPAVETGPVKTEPAQPEARPAKKP